MDDDDKVRRNLVMASCVVIALTVLNVPAGAIANRLLNGTEQPTALAQRGAGATAQPPASKHLPFQEWRVEVMLLVTLVYLGARFHFGEQASNFRHRVRREHDGLLESLVMRLAQKDLRRRPGAPFVLSTEQMPTIDDTARDSLKDAHIAVHPNGELEYNVVSAKGYPDMRSVPNPWRGKVGVRVQPVGDSPWNPALVELEYEIPERLRKRLKRKAQVYSMLAPRDLIDFGIPYLASAGALACTVANLWRSVL